MDALADQRDHLLERLRSLGKVVVTFSGGVDSAVVAQAAYLVNPLHALAVTGISPSLAPHERETARAVAQQIGIRHRELETDEFSNPAYVLNGPDRCFHCKSHLYAAVDAHRAAWGFDTIVNGANRDDLGDYRPGLQAAVPLGVISPLVDCGLDKRAVRDLAQFWNLPVWDKPASPCLSSRVAYGESVTPERLARIDRGEQVLRSLGFSQVRLRYHPQELVRIEVPSDEWHHLARPEIRTELIDRMQELGFQFVTVDLVGFRSGSLNVLVPQPLSTARPAEKDA